jgi:hypothetical protein
VAHLAPYASGGDNGTRSKRYPQPIRFHHAGSFSGKMVRLLMWCALCGLTRALITMTFCQFRKNLENSQIYP